LANFTKKAIKEAFIELLTERPISQITVKDIVERCGINRNSFYYHYQDIPTLIESIVTEEADHIIQTYPSIDTMETGFNVAIEFAEHYQKAILHIYNSANRNLFEQYLWKVCDHIVTSYGNALFSGVSISDMDRDIIGKMYRCQCFGMAIYWMENGRKDDVHKQIARLCELQKGMLEEMIRRAQL